jgi:alpha-N-arabinofuranosidase
MKKLTTLLLYAMVAASSLAANSTLTIDVSHPAGRVSPRLYGLMTEEINHSYDGGLYAELIRFSR